MKLRTLLGMLIVWARPVILRQRPGYLSGAEISSPTGGFYVLDRKNYGRFASVIASNNNEIILSTLSFQHDQSDHTKEQLMDMFKNFAYHLHRCGRLQNSLILSYEPLTCRELLSSGIPCLLDRAAPSPDDLPGSFLTKTVWCVQDGCSASRIAMTEPVYILFDATTH